MHRALLAILLIVPLRLAAEPVAIDAEQWARPRSAATIAALPELRRLLEVYERQPDGRLIVHHAASDEAVLWAEELRAWLVVLGVPSARVRLVADADSGERLLLEARAHGGGR